jgi:hypothetical protein
VGEVQLVVESCRFDTVGLAAWDGAGGGEGWAPGDFDLVDEGDVDFFSGDGLTPQSKVESG